AIAYDDATHQILLFGGLGPAGTVNNATWAWDGTTWLALDPTTSPRARFSASLALNPATHAVVLFGGFALPGVPLGDTWTWDGKNWTQANPAGSPAARGGAGTASDPSGVGVVIFGGSTGSQALGDTWMWDGATWTQRNPSTAPSPRVDAGMAVESGAQTILLFGGSPGTGSPLGDTWAWNGTSWIQLTSAASGARPSSRSGATLGIAPGGEGDVLFGGVLRDGGPTGETWTLGPPRAVPSGAPTSTIGRPASQGTTTTTPNSVPGSSTSGRPTTTRPPSSSSTTKKPIATPAPLGVTARSVHDGDTLTLSGAGFAPHATIVITFRSTPVVVGSTVADQEGRFSVTVAVPAHAPAGQHHFQANGPGPGGGETVLDAAIGVTVPRGRHSWVVPAVMVALTVLLAVGAALVLSVSGRWNRSAAAS
ncbi:MAG TPA: kelch repeat-containing protein, partial [Acidimicrobiales bacterium]|nr:kelch repeat-containing protein [Acidimicrobiales bacterium]